ncbi:MAG: hypothetical protein ACKO6O_02355, partial [Acidimicrobiaceae bacterium]
MSNEKKQLKMLAPEGFREKLSRRAFLQGGTALAGFALVAAACGSSDSDSAEGGGAGGENLASGDWSRVVNHLKPNFRHRLRRLRPNHYLKNHKPQQLVQSLRAQC